MTEDRRLALAAMALSILCGGLVAFGRLHRYHSADSLIPVLVSLQRWTPFYWGQDRYGMLVPLLAAPIRNPLANLVGQAWAMSALACLGPFLAGRYLTGNPRESFVAGALTTIVWLTAVHAPVQFDWLVVQPYGASMSLGFAGLLALGSSARGGVVAGALAVLAACWVSSGVAVLLATAIVLRERRIGSSLVIVAASAVLVSVAGQLVPAPHTPHRLTALASWPGAWRQLAVNAWAIVARPWIVLSFGVAGAACACVTLFRRKRPFAGPIAVAALAALVYFALAGASEWVRLNQFFPRYAYPSVALIAWCLSYAIASVVAPVRKAVAVSAGVLVTVAAWTSGPPSVASIDNGIVPSARPLALDATSAGAAVIAGDYWTVWPAVFHANLAAWRHRAPQTVYGLAFRSAPTEPYWVDRPQLLLAAPAGDPSVEWLAARVGVAATLERRGPRVDLYRVEPARAR